MKTYMTILFLLAGIYVAHADNIYSRTTTVKLPNGDCEWYRTVFYSDNDTPSVNDDIIIGYHDVISCNDNNSIVPEDADAIIIGKDKTLQYKPGTKMITYGDYLLRQAEKDAAMEEKLSTHTLIEVPNTTEVKQIKVTPQKNE